MTELERVDCSHEGTGLHGRLATPQGSGPHAGVLVVPSAHGLGEFACGVASRLAQQGYVALAVDMYGDGAYSTDEAVLGELIKPLWGNSQRLRGRMAAWHDVLREIDGVDPARIAAIGYCFGGQCVLEMARGGADVRAVVSFHGILSTSAPASPGDVLAYVSVHTGGLDPHAPQTDVEALRKEMRAAKAEWQICEYGDAYHSFTEPHTDSPETGRQYNPIADRVSWASTLALLDARLRAA